MARRPSIKYQVLERIDSLKRFGQSKHEAKQQEKIRLKELYGDDWSKYWNPAKVDGIYSYGTADTYKKHAIECVSYIRDHFGIKHLSEVTPLHVASWLNDWIKDRDQISASTLRTKATAMSKVLGISTKDIPFELPVRYRRDIHRSRGNRVHDKNFSVEKNRDIVDFAKGTGLRRRELQSVSWMNIYRDDSGAVKVHVLNGKGGRERHLTVVKQYQEHVWKMREDARSSGREHIFEKVKNRMDVHSYRREYAMARYIEVSSNREPSKSTYTRRDDKKVFDREVLSIITRDMGHGRVDVIVRHYLD